jgi:hypothetical protein
MVFLLCDISVGATDPVARIRKITGDLSFHLRCNNDLYAGKGDPMGRPYEMIHEINH